MQFKPFSFERIELTEVIADRAVALRRTVKLRVPDAIILATARSENLLLVTRNSKDFPADVPGVRMPYRTAPRTDCVPRTF